MSRNPDEAQSLFILLSYPERGSMRKSEIVLFTEDDSNTLFCIVDRGKSGMVGCLHNLFKEVFEAFSLTTRNEGTCLSSLLPRPPVPFRKPGNMFVRITISLLAIWALGFLERSTVFASSTPTQADHVLLFVLEGVGNDAIQNNTPVSYTHLTLPTKRIV